MYTICKRQKLSYWLACVGRSCFGNSLSHGLGGEPAFVSLGPPPCLPAWPNARLLPAVLQYYDDAAGILRSIILSALAPHRLSMPTMPMPAFTMTTDSVRPRLSRLPTAAPCARSPCCTPYMCFASAACGTS